MDRSSCEAHANDNDLCNVMLGTPSGRTPVGALQMSTGGKFGAGVVRTLGLSRHHEASIFTRLGAFGAAPDDLRRQPPGAASPRHAKRRCNEATTQVPNVSPTKGSGQEGGVKGAAEGELNKRTVEKSRLASFGATMRRPPVAHSSLVRLTPRRRCASGPSRRAPSCCAMKTAPILVGVPAQDGGLYEEAIHSTVRIARRGARSEGLEAPPPPPLFSRKKTETLAL